MCANKWLLLDRNIYSKSYHHHHHHHVTPSARISRTLSRHPSLSSIAFGRSSYLLLLVLTQPFGRCILRLSSGVPCLSGHRNDSTGEIILQLWLLIKQGVQEIWRWYSNDDIIVFHISWTSCLINSRTLKIISLVVSFLCPCKQGTPEEGRGIQRPKRWVSINNYKYEDNSPKK